MPSDDDHVGAEGRRAGSEKSLAGVPYDHAGSWHRRSRDDAGCGDFSRLMGLLLIADRRERHWDHGTGSSTGVCML
jgi:hypothetical protein